MRRSTCLAAVLALVAAGNAWAVPAPPRPIVFEDDDGARFAGRLYGDERGTWAEDLEGRALAFDRLAGAWHFAVRGPAGGLVPTPIRAGGAAAPAPAESRGARPDPGGAVRPERLSVPRMSRLPARPGARVKNLVLPVAFRNQAPAIEKDRIDELFNGAAGSVAAYWGEVSGGAMRVESTVVPWIALANDDAWYAYNDQASGEHTHEMIAEAVASLDAQGFDFAPFDAGDGTIPVVTVIHSGPGYETTANPRYIHSHFGGLDGTVVTKSGLMLLAYHTEPEVDDAGRPTPVGAICHEMGHGFGLPDLYDADYDSAGLGDWCLMAAGSWTGPRHDGSSPSHLCAWARAQLGFVEPRTVESTQPGMTLAPLGSGGEVLRLDAGMPTQQYFLAENRQQIGFDAFLPGSGLLVLHVDDRVFDNTNPNHFLVDVEQADGLRGLNLDPEDWGDEGDLFPYGSSTSFTPDTVPSSKPYGRGVSRVHLTGIARRDDRIDLDVVVALPLGEICGGPGECASGFCASGVCCDKACGGACEACAGEAQGLRVGHCLVLTGVACDDHDPCTSGDVCRAGVCVGQRPTCEASGECRVASCDPTSGACSAPPLSDGTACSEGACDEGECRPKGCGCASARSDAWPLAWLVAGAALWRRRRVRQASEPAILAHHRREEPWTSSTRLSTCSSTSTAPSGA